MPTVAHALLAPQAQSAAHVPPTAHATLAAHACAVPCVPAASIATADLRAVLNHRRDGKDSHITIERQHER
jgi:hypothetical protein